MAIVTCPSCATRFNLNPAILGSAGKTVTCSKCKHKWLQKADDLELAPGDTAPPPAPEIKTAPQDTEMPQSGEAASAPSEEIAAAIAEPSDGASFKEMLAEKSADAAETTEPPAPVDAKGKKVKKAKAEKPKKIKTPKPAKAAKPAKGAPGGFWIAICILILLSFFAGFFAVARDSVVVAWPPAARIYMLMGMEVNVLGAGLEITNVQWKRPENAAPASDPHMQRIAITGAIKNVSQHVQTVPLLLGKIVDTEQRLIHHWTFKADAEEVAIQDETHFTTEVEVPSNMDIRVIITFTEELSEAGDAAHNPEGEEPLPLPATPEGDGAAEPVPFDPPPPLEELKKDGDAHGAAPGNPHSSH